MHAAGATHATIHRGHVGCAPLEALTVETTQRRRQDVTVRRPDTPVRGRGQNIPSPSDRSAKSATYGGPRHASKRQLMPSSSDPAFSEINVEADDLTASASASGM